MENGGGYDDFLHKLADDTGMDHGNILNAVEVSGLDTEAAPTPAATDEAGHGHGPGSFNEHVWYSLPAMSRLADAIAAKLGELEPAAAPTFLANAEAFKDALGPLEERWRASGAADAHVPVAMTEPVPLYLLEAAGLENKTPAEYTVRHRGGRRRAAGGPQGSHG